MELWMYVVVAILPLPNLWAIWHAFFHSFPSAHERLLWICCGVFIPIVGGIAYLIFGLKRSSKPVRE